VCFLSEQSMLYDCPPLFALSWKSTCIVSDTVVREDQYSDRACCTVSSP